MGPLNNELRSSVSITLPSHILQQIDKRAARDRRSRSSQIAWMVEQALKEPEPFDPVTASAEPLPDDAP